jgi:hypothetical protein
MLARVRWARHSQRIAGTMNRIRDRNYAFYADFLELDTTQRQQMLSACIVQIVLQRH